ncbi:MAG: DUF1624 domain-containing protein [Ignavibacteria bacterium]|nr:DUF1624 domain-containing protein [Ignavibacteria bacterium]
MGELLPARKQRLIFIDLMRGIAALWMIETHVVNAFLNYHYQSGWFFNLISISNGYVAVGFVFCAGSGFWIAASRKTDEYKRFTPALWTYLRRLGFILAAAYWAHFPEFSFWRIIRSTPEQILAIMQCDVLHCIVFSSIIALTLVIILPKKVPFTWIYALMSVMFFFATPLAWASDPLAYLPVFPATLFTNQPISPFPLFPWSGYFFAGAAITGWFMQSADQKRFAKRLLLVGLGLPVILFIIKDLPFTYPGWQDWWIASPSHSLFRASGAALLFGLLFLTEGFFNKIPRVTDVLRLCGQESLFIYLLQGMLIYGSVANVGVKHFLPTIVTPLEIVILTSALIAVCYSLAHIWNTYKNHDALRARRTIALLSILFIVVFMLVPAN